IRSRLVRGRSRGGSWWDRASTLLSPLACRSLDGVDADDGDAEVAQPVEETVQLGRVGEIAGERGLAFVRLELELVECAREGQSQATADDDPVAARLADLLHGGQAGGRRGGLSPPAAAVHPGWSAPRPARLRAGRARGRA